MRQSLNQRVRVSSFWRCTRSDLGLHEPWVFFFWPAYAVFRPKASRSNTARHYTAAAGPLGAASSSSFAKTGG